MYRSIANSGRNGLKRKARAAWKAARKAQVARYASMGLGAAPKRKRVAQLNEGEPNGQA